MKQTSRREFLKLAGKGVLGAAALSTVPAMLPALAEEYGYPYNQLNARMFADGAGGYGALLTIGCKSAYKFPRSRSREFLSKFSASLGIIVRLTVLKTQSDRTAARSPTRSIAASTVLKTSAK